MIYLEAVRKVLAAQGTIGNVTNIERQAQICDLLAARLTAECSALRSMLSMAGEQKLVDAFRDELRKAL